MADLPSSSEPDPHALNDPAVARDRELMDQKTPRWVKVFGIIGICLLLLMVIALMSGHGPGRHFRSNHGTGGRAPAAGRAP